MARQTFARRDVLGALTAIGSGLAGLPARAASGKVLFGFPHGNTGFPLAAALLQEIQRNGSYQPDLGDDLVHLPGNAGALAIKSAFNAAADGATVLLAPSSNLTLLPLVRPMLPIEPVRDFVPVAALSGIGIALALGSQVPARITTLKDYAAWARQNPAQCAYGVPGLGTMPHFIGTVLAEALDLPLKPVVYNAAATIAADLAGGGLPAGVLVAGEGMRAAVANDVRVVAVATDERWPKLPDVPTMREAGIGRLPPMETFGFFVRTDVPEAKVRQLREAVTQTLRSPAMADVIAASWHLPVPRPAEDYVGQIAQERANWVDLVKSRRFSEQA